MAAQTRTTKLEDEPTCFCCFPLQGGTLTLGYVNLIYTLYQTISRFFTLSSSDIIAHNKLLFMVSLFLLNGFWLCINIACLVNLHRMKQGPLVFYFFAIIIDRILYVVDGVIFIYKLTRIPNTLPIFRSVDLVLPLQFLYYFSKCMKHFAAEREKIDQPPPATIEAIERSAL